LTVAVTEIFATETMAELCVRQGRVSDAAAIYRALLERLGSVAEAGDGRRVKWTTRLAELQGIERAPTSAPPPSPSSAWAGTPGGVAAGGSQRSGSATRPHGGSADDRTRRALETMAAQIGADDPPAPRPARAAVAVAVAVAAADTAALAPAPRPEASAPPPTGSAEPPHPAASSTGREMATPGGAPALRLPVLIQHPVRSGQIVYAEGTDLIVLASVNAGAQLLADGNIHVYGVLRGRAIAGVKGASGARIFCQRLEAELVGIDVHFITAEGLPTEVAGKAAQVFIDRGQCVVMRM
jgi:septum formation inhibitor MinC